MSLENGRQKPQRSCLLSRRDWIYLLSLLLPFAAYDLALKGYLVVSWPKDLGFAESLRLMRSDILFTLGYALFWVGLFAAARESRFRPILVVLFHVATILTALISTVAYEYFMVTGSTLDTGFILFSLSSPDGLGAVMESEASPSTIAVIFVVLVYALAGPWLLTRVLDRSRLNNILRSPVGTSWLALSVMGIAACALLSLSLLPGGSGGIARPGKAFSLDAFVNVALTAAEAADNASFSGAADAPSADVEFVPDAGSEQRRNVVLVHLESTRAKSVTPYNEDLETTPFMEKLAKESLLAENAYAVVPHTTNAIATANCGIDPPLNPWQTSSLGDRVLSRCIADLLGGQGYDTAWFTSSTSTFEIERLPELVKNLGYQEFYPVESMDTEGFEQANYFGYEDDVMLEPSRKWLEEHRDAPFLVTYETITPHHQYLAPEQSYGREEFDEDEQVNRYQNSVRYQDFFLKNLFEQYKELGLYENTVFVLYGDHGEAFGEHGRYQHDNAIYEEGIKIPLVVHDPQRFKEGVRVTQPVSQLDILPTVAGLLGYEIEGGAYEGDSLLEPLAEDRTVKTSCWSESGCLASIKGTMKYVYHFDDAPDELFDLSEDPLEEHNLAAAHPEEVEARRAELLEWRAKVNAMYGSR